MTLPLRMDRMHAKTQSETSNISCPQELHVDEEDWRVADPNLYPQTYRTKEQISILKLGIGKENVSLTFRRSVVDLRSGQDAN